MDFWKEVEIANACLCLWLLERKNTADMNEKMVIDAYQKAWNFAGSLNKKIAEIEHFDFLINAWSTFSTAKPQIKAITKIRTDLKNFLK